jgi:hypothetical protein
MTVLWSIDIEKDVQVNIAGTLFNDFDTAQLILNRLEEV